MNPDREPDERQEATDLEHLRVLSIGYYIMSGLAAVCALLPVFHLAIGIAIVTGQFPQGPAARNQQGNVPPELVGWIFVCVAGFAILFGRAFSIGLLIAGRMLRRRRRYMFCVVMAGGACLHQPFGLVLGIFSLLVLTRRSVRTLFDRNAPPAAADPPGPDEYGRDDRWD